MITSCGSPCYAAPEVVVSDGMYAGTAVDVWSCGVILYAMLAGYLPFDDDPSNPEGDNINQLYKYILTTELVFPDHISYSAKSLLKRILVSDPSERATMAEIRSHEWLEPYSHFFKDIESHIHRDSDTPSIQVSESTHMLNAINLDQMDAFSNELELNDTQDQFVPLEDQLVFPDNYFRLPNSTNPEISFSNSHRDSFHTDAILPDAHMLHDNVHRNASFDDLKSLKNSSSDYTKFTSQINSSQQPNNTFHGSPSQGISYFSQSKADNMIVTPIKSYSEPINISPSPFLKNKVEFDDDNGFDELMKIILVNKDKPTKDSAGGENPYMEFSNSSNTQTNQDYSKDLPQSSNQFYDFPISHSSYPNSYHPEGKHDYFCPDFQFDFQDTKPKNSLNVAESQTKTYSGKELKDVKKQLHSRSDSILNSIQHPKDPQQTPNSSHTHISSQIPLIPLGNTDFSNSESLKDSILKKVANAQPSRLRENVPSSSLRVKPNLVTVGIPVDSVLSPHSPNPKSKELSPINLGFKIGAGIASQPIKSRNNSNRNSGISGKRVLDFFSGNSKKSNNRLSLRQDFRNGEVISIANNDAAGDSDLSAIGKSSTPAGNTAFVDKKTQIPNSTITDNKLNVSSAQNADFHRFITEGPQILSQMRTHRGAIDPLCISSMPPSELFQHILQTLDNLGLIVISTHGLSARVLRPKISDKSLLKPIVIGATYPISLPIESNFTISDKNIPMSDRRESATGLSARSDNSESSFVIYENLNSSKTQDYKEKGQPNITTDSPIFLNPPIIRTRATPVVPTYDITPVDGSSLDRGIHGEYEPANSKKSDQFQLFGLTNKFKLLKRALTKTGPRSSVAASPKSKPAIENIYYDTNDESERRILQTNYFTEETSMQTKNMETFPRSFSNQNTKNNLAPPEKKFVPSKCAPVPPPYGNSSLDSNDEVQFNVEVCKLKNLSHLFVVTLSRRKGNAWSYKYLYHLFIDSLNLKKYGVYMENPYASIIVPFSNISISPAKESSQFNQNDKNTSQKPNSLNADQPIPIPESNLASNSYPVMLNN
ncbi:Fatty acyl-CoA synthetase and RNA processing-associated kinase 1 [Smittium mucronatum]|uniref:non-specific serine/threonine protein kinase n=1 Tax=Smittium mucronatum TaxID=133383 RepID=A0A1R0GTW6_9FUNG|nr:Fatty acyl-CoA synthetase and RNA processing-associated kinase 1 [Smittium mucronatum]